MNAIKATWKNGQIVPDEPVNWPEGRRLIVAPEPLSEIGGMTEEEQGDDPESIARWVADFDALPPLVLSPAEEADLAAWRQKMKEFNVEAVRRQMEEGIP
jgi:hypothetical protein